MKYFLFNPLLRGAGQPDGADVDYWASATTCKTPRGGAMTPYRYTKRNRLSSAAATIHKFMIGLTTNGGNLFTPARAGSTLTFGKFAEG